MKGANISSGPFLTLLLLLGVFYVILFFPPLARAAEGQVGTFACQWNGDECMVDQGAVNCGNGFLPDPGRCKEIRNQGVCNSTKTLSCTVPIGLSEKVGNLYNWAVSLAGLVALGLIIYGGVVYASSAGNPSRITEAKAWITHALLGLFMLLGAYLILGFINPDLTKLDEVFLAQNVNPQSQGMQLGGNVPEECIVQGQTAMNESLAATEGNEDCLGRYYTSAVPVGGERADILPARAGNFGDDPDCNRVGKNPEENFWGRLIRLAELQADMLSIVDRELKDYEPDNDCIVCCESQVTALKTKITGVLADCESGGKNPNATRFPWDGNFDETHEQCTGAWGLFQMGYEGNPEQNGPYDIGNVPWREQVEYVVHYIMDKGNPNPGEVFACWKQNTLGTFDDFLGVCRCYDAAVEENWCWKSDTCNPPATDPNTGELHKKTISELCAGS